MGVVCCGGDGDRQIAEIIRHVPNAQQLARWRAVAERKKSQEIPSRSRKHSRSRAKNHPKSPRAAVEMEAERWRTITQQEQQDGVDNENLCFVPIGLSNYSSQLELMRSQEEI